MTRNRKCRRFLTVAHQARDDRYLENVRYFPDLGAVEKRQRRGYRSLSREAVADFRPPAVDGRRGDVSALSQVVRRDEAPFENAGDR